MLVHRDSQKEKEGRNNRKKETATGSETEIDSMKERQKTREIERGLISMVAYRESQIEKRGRNYRKERDRFRVGDRNRDREYERKKVDERDREGVNQYVCTHRESKREGRKE